MSDFEILSIVLMIISIIAAILIEYIRDTKKVTARPRKGYFFKI